MALLEYWKRGTLGARRYDDNGSDNGPRHEDAYQSKTSYGTMGNPRSRVFMDGSWFPWGPARLLSVHRHARPWQSYFPSDWTRLSYICC